MSLVDPTTADAQLVSDDDLASEFTRRIGLTVRYVAAWGKWLIWDGARYKPDDKLAVWDMARRIAKDVLATKLLNVPLTDSKRQSLSLRLGSAQTIAALLKLAASDTVHAVAADMLDADLLKINTLGGILDLTTGLLTAHDPGALMTKVTAGAPESECPIFQRTLERCLPDAEVRDYVQRLAGYCLTGVVREHVLPFPFGTGRNGKGVIFNAIKHALGDYAIPLPAEVLMESRNERHPTEIAVLRGTRLAIASEIESGQRWNESRLKRLTGGDPISARYIARDPFEFQPTHKLIVIANTKPALRVVDAAIRGRIHLISFSVEIPVEERDTELLEKLKAEAGGILGWALAGCLDWQKSGLSPPASVLAATADYFTAEDTIAQWASECCRPVGDITLAAAHQSFREWCETNALPALGRNQFGEQLEAHGYRRIETRKRHWVYTGLSLPVREEVRYAD